MAVSASTHTKSHRSNNPIPTTLESLSGFPPALKIYKIPASHFYWVRYWDGVRISRMTPDCRDSFDVPFLQLAIAGKADALVTGDQDLLCLAGHFECPILTAEQFIQDLYS